tara:strand:+ start:184 stop:1092 length:909 start_codon:yes stop_codon:yes gene_type:complete
MAEQGSGTDNPHPASSAALLELQQTFEGLKLTGDLDAGVSAVNNAEVREIDPSAMQPAQVSTPALDAMFGNATSGSGGIDHLIEEITGSPSQLPEHETTRLVAEADTPLYKAQFGQNPVGITNSMHVAVDDSSGRSIAGQNQNEIMQKVVMGGILAADPDSHSGKVTILYDQDVNGVKSVEVDVKANIETYDNGREVVEKLTLEISEEDMTASPKLAKIFGEDRQLEINPLVTGHNSTNPYILDFSSVERENGIVIMPGPANSDLVNKAVSGMEEQLQRQLDAQASVNLKDDNTAQATMLTT